MLRSRSGRSPAFTALIQASGLKRALAPYMLAAPYGRLLGGDVEHLGESPFQTFETEGLVGTPAGPAMLSYPGHGHEALWPLLPEDKTALAAKILNEVWEAA